MKHGTEMFLRCDVRRVVRQGQGAVVVHDAVVEVLEHAGVVVDHLSYRADELNDKLGHPVPRRSLTTNHDSPGHEVAVGVGLDTVVHDNSTSAACTRGSSSPGCQTWTRG